MLRKTTMKVFLKGNINLHGVPRSQFVGYTLYYSTDFDKFYISLEGKTTSNGIILNMYCIDRFSISPNDEGKTLLIPDEENEIFSPDFYIRKEDIK